MPFLRLHLDKALPLGWGLAVLHLAVSRPAIHIQSGLVSPRTSQHGQRGTKLTSQDAVRVGVGQSLT